MTLAATGLTTTVPFVIFIVFALFLCFADARRGDR